MDRAAVPPRFPHLDGVRAIAALSVLGVHTAGLTTFTTSNDLLGPLTARLNVGVAIFFVLSGFLLYRPFVAARLADRDAPRIGGYLRRRALRIVPAYWLALTLLAIWPGLNGVFTKDWWVYYGFAQNLRGGWILQGIGPAWTLHVEITFYALLPFLALGAARWLRGRPVERQLWPELAAIAVLGLLSLALRAWRSVAGSPTEVGANILPQLFLWFALGLALAVVSAHVADRPVGRRPGWVRFVGAHPGVPWAGAVAVLLLSTQVGLPILPLADYDTYELLCEHVLYALIAVLVVLPAAIGTDGGGRVRALLASRPLVWLGLVSYGVYLWHLPLGEEINARLGPRVADLGFPIITLAVLAASLVAATLSYTLVERPLMRRFRGSPAPRAAERPAPVPAG